MEQDQKDKDLNQDVDWENVKKNSPEELLSKLGRGLGKRRKSEGGPGKGKRLKSGLNSN